MSDIDTMTLNNIENQTNSSTAAAATTIASSSSSSSSPSMKKDKKKKSDRPKSVHPTTAIMVNNAIENLKERGGSSLQAIKKYISATYKIDAEKFSPFIKKYLKASVTNGILVQTKGKGASGSFKLASNSVTKKSTPKNKNTPAAAPSSSPKNVKKIKKSLSVNDDKVNKTTKINKRNKSTTAAAGRSGSVAIKKSIKNIKNTNNVPVTTAAADKKRTTLNKNKKITTKSSPSKVKKTNKVPTNKPKTPKPKTTKPKVSKKKTSLKKK